MFLRTLNREVKLVIKHFKCKSLRVHAIIRYTNNFRIPNGALLELLLVCILSVENAEMFVADIGQLPSRFFHLSKPCYIPSLYRFHQHLSPYSVLFMQCNDVTLTNDKTES